MDMKAVDGHLFEIKERRKATPAQAFATAPLSQVIRMAVEDLRKVEAQPRKYRVDMTDWYQPGSFWKRCGVCFAGSVMVGRLGGGGGGMDLEDFGRHIADRLMALNEARCGNFVTAADRLGYRTADLISVEKAFDGFFVVPYASDPARFKLQMLTAADIYEGLGL